MTPQLLYFILFASPVIAGDTWDDFYNNFATDLTPLLALFGEQVTKQFLSESISIWDNIIFAMAPLGILTAVVSVIRLHGSSSLRAFIGRAQEARALSEAELCSSTSEDVCEVFHEGGVARVFGKPKLLEVILDKNCGDFYPKYGGNEIFATPKPPDAHIFTLQEYFPQGLQRKDDEEEEPTPENRRTQVTFNGQRKVGDADSNQAKESNDECSISSPSPPSNHSGQVMDNGQKEVSDADANQAKESNDECSISSPCLSRITKRPSSFLALKLAGRLLRLGGGIERGWNVKGEGRLTAGIQSEEQGDDRFAPSPNLSLNVSIKHPSKPLLYLAAFIGCALQTGVYGFALWITYVRKIGREGKPITPWAFPVALTGTVFLVFGMFLCARIIETSTREFVLKKSARGPRILWLQQGNQTIAEQVFEKFAYSATLDEYLVSKKNRASLNGSLVWVAVTSTSVGFVLQFIGLRGLHSFVALSQLCATILMTMIRAVLRSQRLKDGSNELRASEVDYDGHELDWFAHRLEGEYESQLSASGPSGKEFLWEVQPPELSKDDNYSMVGDHGRARSGGLHCIIEKLDPYEVTLFPRDYHRRAQTWIRELELDYKGTGAPNTAARILYLRARLAQLTDGKYPGILEKWVVDIRDTAKALAAAINGTVNILHSKSLFSIDDHRPQTMFWRIDVCTEREEHAQPIHIMIHFDDIKGWKVDGLHLEAVLGLWTYSLTKHSESCPEPGFKLLGFMDSEAEARYARQHLEMWGAKCFRTQTFQLNNPKSHTGQNIPIFSIPLFFNKAKPWDLSQRRYDPTFRGTVALGMVTNRKLPFICAQDIFAGFLSHVADTIKYNIADEFRVSIQCRHLGALISNPIVVKIADAFVQSGLGDMNEALQCIIPILDSKSIFSVDASTVLQLVIRERRGKSSVTVMDLLNLGFNRLGKDESTLLEYRPQFFRQRVEMWRQSVLEHGKGVYSQLLLLCDEFPNGYGVGEVKEQYMWAAYQLSTVHGYSIIDVDYAEERIKTEANKNLVPDIETMSLSSVLESENLYPVCLIIRARWSDSLHSFRSTGGECAMCIAARRGCSELVEDIHYSRPKGTSMHTDCAALHLAAQEGHLNILTFLLDYSRFRMETQNSMGQTPLWIAAANGHDALIRELLERDKGTMETRDSEGRTPLWIAAANLRASAVMTLLENGAKVDSQNILGETPLMAVKWSGNESDDAKRVVEYLCDYRA